MGEPDQGKEWVEQIAQEWEEEHRRIIYEKSHDISQVWHKFFLILLEVYPKLWS